MATKVDPFRVPQNGSSAPGVRDSWVHRQEIATRGNVFDAILRLGHDEDFVPRRPGQGTDAQPGSPEKVAVLAARGAAGEPLWHPDDRVDCDGLTGGSRR